MLFKTNSNHLSHAFTPRKAIVETCDTFSAEKSKGNALHCVRQGYTNLFVKFYNDVYYMPFYRQFKAIYHDKFCNHAFSLKMIVMYIYTVLKFIYAHSFLGVRLEGLRDERYNDYKKLVKN